MEELRPKLLKAYKDLVIVNETCFTQVDHECQIKNLTLTQVEYLKIIDRHEHITTSLLATVVNNSKPTVTEMVKKFEKYDCVYKVQCEDDARKSYIMLTPLGEKVARMEHLAMERVVDNIMNKLSKDEIEYFIQLLEKISKE